MMPVTLIVVCQGYFFLMAYFTLNWETVEWFSEYFKYYDLMWFLSTKHFRLNRPTGNEEIEKFFHF